VLIGHTKFVSMNLFLVWQDRARVARLAFLRPNYRNLVFFKVVWHEKMVFGIYVIFWHFLAFFDGVGMR